MSQPDATPPATEPGRIVRHDSGDQTGWSRWFPGLRTLRGYQHGVVAPRPDGRAGADHDAGAGGHCLCGGIGRTGHLWPVRHHRAADRLCAVRPQPDPGAGAGFFAGGRDPRRGPAAVGRRSAARSRPGGHDGHRFGGGVYPGGHRAPGFHHRVAVQADSLRLHERDRADGADQPVAEVLRLFHRFRGAAAKPVGHRDSADPGQNQLDRVHGRRRHPAGDPAAQEPQAHTRHPDRGGRRDGRRGCAGPGGARGGRGPRRAAPGPAGVRHSLDHQRRYRARPDRRWRRGPGVLRRHQRALACVRGAHPYLRRPQPGNGRAGHCQPGRRIVPGVCRSAAVPRARPWPKPLAPGPS